MRGGEHGRNNTSRAFDVLVRPLAPARKTATAPAREVVERGTRAFAPLRAGCETSRAKASAIDALARFPAVPEVGRNRTLARKRRPAGRSSRPPSLPSAVDVRRRLVLVARTRRAKPIRGAHRSMREPGRHAGGMSVGAAHQPAEGRHVVLDGRTLTPAGVVAIARGRAQARVSAAARERNAAAERLVDELLDRGELLYGTSTGVGVLRSSPSALEDAGENQWRLVRSHAGGGGGALTVEVVRAAMAVRANQIGAGGAGIGEGLLDALLGALRAGVTPFARELGSLGTGDLTVLAEIGVALGGEGRCWVGDDAVPTAEAMEAHGLSPAT